MRALVPPGDTSMELTVRSFIAMKVIAFYAFLVPRSGKEYTRSEGLAHATSQSLFLCVFAFDYYL